MQTVSRASTRVFQLLWDICPALASCHLLLLQALHLEEGSNREPCMLKSKLACAHAGVECGKQIQHRHVQIPCYEGSV